MGADRYRAYSARYGARAPALASWPAAGLYLVWRGLIAGLRPAVFLALILGGLWFLAAAVRVAPPPSAIPVETQDQMAAAFEAVEPGHRQRRSLWVDAASAALSSEGGNLPDAPLAQSLVRAAFMIEGGERVALEMLAEGRRPAALEADLRARPAQEREGRLHAALQDVVERGRAENLDPPHLILAPRALQTRLSAVRRLYGPALNDAEAWFAAPDGRALSLSRLPGFQAGSGALYGDARDVIVHGCAFAQAAGRRIGQCRVGFLPKPDADPILAGLALAVMGAQDQARAGARIVKAAYAAGLMDRAFAERLAFGADAELGREALLAAVMPVLAEAGLAWTQPVRYGARLRAAADEAAQAAHLDRSDRARVFTAVGAVRREAGALTAVRLTASLQTQADAEALARLARTDGPRLLALHHLSAGAFADLLSAQQSARTSWREQVGAAREELALSALLMISALFFLLSSLLAGYRRARGAGPGWLERLDGAVTRLILGKNF